MSRRIVAFIDHEIGYRLLEKIIYNQAMFGFDLVAAVTTQDNGQKWWPGVSDLCNRSRIPLHRYHEPFCNILDYADIDWYFLLSWKHIISPELIKGPKFGVINLHYSLLPEYRGVYPVNWAIIDGQNKTGVTYHIVNEKIDNGQIICQKEAEISLCDTARSLQLRLDDVAFELFDEMVDWVRQGNLQSEAILTQVIPQGKYKSRVDFIESNELDLDHEYRTIDLINLLRGKTFMPDSKNLYIRDPVSGKRIYVNVCLRLSD